MKVIVNGKFLTQRVTGVQRYAREILNELDKICCGLEVELAIPKNIIDLPQYENIVINKVGKLKGNLWEQISFPRYVKKQKAISLNLCNSAPLSGEKIVTVHDVKIKAHPEFFSKKFLWWYKILFKNYVKKAKLIITDSEFSKSEIIKYFKVYDEKISVIYCGWQHFNRISYDNEALNKYGLNKNDFYFTISSLEPNKNLKWIVEVAKINRESLFIVAGGINKKIFTKKNLSLPENVKLIGYITDNEAKTLMRDCKAFLFPTIYEGFGIPPLEALSSGANKLIVSDTEVMHEIFGERSIFINPNRFNYNLSEFDNSDDKKDVVLNKYSWESSAKKLFNIINSL